MRLDIYLSEKGIVKSRETARRLITEGGVTVNGNVISKPAKEVSENDEIKLCAELPAYVGRGGLKLEKALKTFGISVGGLTCLDIGASTGGFTDCLLQNGAAYVYAVDVGHGQLDESLARDSRVNSMEGVNIKDISQDEFEREIGFICCDVSFISLKQVIPKICQLLSEKGEAVLLVKPQFECGRADIGKKGIVRSEKVHMRVLADIIAFCGTCSLFVRGVCHSPIQGGDGNIEYLIFAGKTPCTDSVPDCGEIVRNAHMSFKKERKS